MGKLIERDAAVEVLNQLAREHFSLSDGFQFYIDALKDVELNVMALPTVDAVPVVRCKDCKHRPTGDEMEDLEFPDNRCPCRCEDYWYSWKPSDDWFCPYGERKDGEAHD